MFARVKKSGRYQYLQIVENRKIKGKVVPRVVGTMGRMAQLQPKDGVENLVRSLARFSGKTLLVLSAKSDVDAQGVRIGPALIFQRLCSELGLPQIFRSLVAERKFEFDVERAIFLTVLHRLFDLGSDRSCNRWREGYAIEGVQQLALHHSYRAMAYLAEVLEDQSGATPFAPRCVKGLVEEKLCARHRDLFTALGLVFFDTTSISFEGEGGETIGQLGNTKDRRPHCKQMVVGVVLDDRGRPIWCEMWPGNTADVKTLVPVVERLRKRFHIGHFCIVADRGMISAETIETLERPDCNIPHTLGARMPLVKEVSKQVLCRPGRYRQVRPQGRKVKDPSPLMVHDRGSGEAHRQLRLCPISQDAQGRRDHRAEQDRRGVPVRRLGVLRTNMDLGAELTVLRHKELWTVEDVKSVLETRPIFHKRDATLRGHVFCSFLALVMRTELDIRLQEAGHVFEWADITRDLSALEQITIEDNGRKLAVRTACTGTCGKILRAAGVRIPPRIREL
jgi:hypothetical protein